MLTSHWSNPTHRKKTPQLRETMTFQTTQRACKYSNLNKMKKQRNIQQMKENDKDKNPPNQNQPTNKPKKKEIGSLLEKDFRIMIVKMIQNLENKMELQINRLETRTEKM